MSGFLSLMTLAGETKSSEKQVPLKLKRETKPVSPMRVPMQIPVQVYYSPVEMTVTVDVDSDDNVNGEILLYHDGSVIDDSLLSTSTFVLPYPGGTYSIHIVTQTWEAIGDFEL